MFGIKQKNKLGQVLAQVESFMTDLEKGIEDNNVVVEANEAKANTIIKETEVAVARIQLVADEKKGVLIAANQKLGAQRKMAEKLLKRLQ